MMRWYYIPAEMEGDESPFTTEENLESEADALGVSVSEFIHIPEFDGKEEITQRDLADADWWQYCNGCSQMINGHDSYNRNDEPVEAVFSEKGEIFCCMECLRRELASRMWITKKKAEAENVIFSKFPFVTEVRSFNGGVGPCHECFRKDHENAAAEFMFPGAKHGGQYCHGCGRFWISHGDKPLFDELKKQSKTT